MILWFTFSTYQLSSYCKTLKEFKEREGPGLVKALVSLGRSMPSHNVKNVYGRTVVDTKEGTNPLALEWKKTKFGSSFAFLPIFVFCS